MGDLYTNNFKGRAGRKERAKQLVDEFEAIEDAFTRLQALNIATYLTTYVNSTLLSGVVTVSPDNGYLQELTLTGDIALQIAAPLNEAHYRMSLLIHGGSYKVTNLWGAQTWKEYGLGNWYELYCGEGPYASMLLDFYWDRCSQTWICVASSKNQFNYLLGSPSLRFYPLHHNLDNVEGDDTLGFTRASSGMTTDDQNAYHHRDDNLPRFHGIRYIDNWIATASDLTSVGWVPLNVTVNTDVGAGPDSEDVNRLTFTATDGRIAAYVLPSFGRAGFHSDSIKVAVSFHGRMVSGTGSVRVFASHMGKISLDPPVHDVVQVNMTSSWALYGCVLDVCKTGNQTTSLALNRQYPRTLIEIAIGSPSGSLGADVQITNVQCEILRGTDEEVPSPERMDSTIGASMTLTATGTGSWVDATKTLTISAIGQFVEFGGSLEVGKTYLVHARLQSGVPCDIRMANQVTVWAAGEASGDLYLQEAPFVFQYDGGDLTFALTYGGTSSVYLVDIYELSGHHGLNGYQNLTTVGANGQLSNTAPDPTLPLTSGILDGVAREIASENLIPFVYYRTFSLWDSVGLAGVNANDCKNPVFQSEYGIDQWPARATIVQGASKTVDGFIQRVFTIPAAVASYDFTIWIRRTIDVSGNQVVTPQHDDVTVPISAYVDFEAELTSGPLTVGGARVRLDIQNGTLHTNDVLNYTLNVLKWPDWYQVVIQLANTGAYDGFRVRLYPASADVPDSSVIDVTQQGWAIIDWAQFEVAGGTYLGSSPIVGGETRAIENFTSALADGDYYLAPGNVHIAALVSNSIVWDDDDGVYKDVIYSTVPMIPQIEPGNMHEFGLVEVVSVPSGIFTTATTTLYPIENEDALEFAASLLGGDFRTIPMEDLDVFFHLQYGDMHSILISTGPYGEALDVTFTMAYGTLYQILKTIGPKNEAMDVSFHLQYGDLDAILVTADTPDEALEFSASLIDGELL